MDDDKKKKLIIAAACVLAVLILAFICLRVFGGVQKSSGRYFDTELRGSGSKELTLSVKGDVPEGYSWQLQEYRSVLDATEVKNEPGLYRIKITYAPVQEGEEKMSSDFSSTVFLDCTNGDSVYTTLGLHLNGDGKKLEGMPAAFVSEEPLFTALESDEEHAVYADDGVYKLTVRVEDERCSWKAESYDDSILKVVRTDVSEDWCVFEITGVGSGTAELLLIGKRLDTGTVLTIESVEVSDADANGQSVPLGVYELHLKDSRSESYTDPDVAAVMDTFCQAIPAFRLPEGLVPMDAGWYDINEAGGVSFFDLGEEKVAYIKCAYGSEDVGVYVSDRCSAEQMTSVFSVLRELEPAPCGDGLIYDLSALGEDGGAAVLTEGSTVFLFTARYDASVLPAIIEGL